MSLNPGFELNFTNVPKFKQDDPKLGSILQSGEVGDLILIGFPFDEGVQRNGGRTGSALGPSCLRSFLSKIGPIVNPEYEIDLSNLHISDIGDIQATGFDLSHKILRETVFSLISQKKIPIVIGGGKDQSWSNGLAFLDYCANSQSTPVVINIDAHLDVRGLDDLGQVHSGCAFKLLLEAEKFHSNNGKFLEYACQGSQCARSHVDFVKQHFGELLWMRDIRKTIAPQGDLLTQAGVSLKNYLDQQDPHCKIFISFEIDAISSRDCPGVSCPSVDGGLTSEEALEIMLICGKDHRIQLVDLSEYNPPVEEYRTGRLVANMIYYFAMGFIQR